MRELSGSDREDLIAAGRAALAQLEIAFDTAIADVVQRVEAASGERLLARRPGVLDAGWTDLARMSWQASNFEGAVRLLRPVMEHDERTLGAVLKTANPVLVRDVTRHLVEAGVLPHPEEVPQ
ncbi:hypothetical protein [Streptomyces sp. NBC_00620]|uniref:hypothetical protein n=1 Tax=Streptomyces sp. NBC_00620 TaxID=2903666 RepID=UPI00225BD41D|nr:hypothetical protein [Streptomyces sp. NBC_00620]MCX4973153.1 hypothetical protein [Streptomyces sp. NBC_00620]